MSSSQGDGLSLTSTTGRSGREETPQLERPSKLDLVGLRYPPRGWAETYTGHRGQLDPAPFQPRNCCLPPTSGTGAPGTQFPRCDRPPPKLLTHQTAGGWHGPREEEELELVSLPEESCAHMLQIGPDSGGRAVIMPARRDIPIGLEPKGNRLSVSEGKDRGHAKALGRKRAFPPLPEPWKRAACCPSSQSWGLSFVRGCRDSSLAQNHIPGNRDETGKGEGSVEELGRSITKGAVGRQLSDETGASGRPVGQKCPHNQSTWSASHLKTRYGQAWAPPYPARCTGRKSPHNKGH